mmetsp:Transcript_113437/g.321327  ORF Transcript_113437/g.321327 Transcript_113437/m.321327 type:complete len:286 (-) Transcript_113437:823-1680(-)
MHPLPASAASFHAAPTPSQAALARAHHHVRVPEAVFLRTCGGDPPRRRLGHVVWPVPRARFEQAHDHRDTRRELLGVADVQGLVGAVLVALRPQDPADDQRGFREHVTEHLHQRDSPPQASVARVVTIEDRPARLGHGRLEVRLQLRGVPAGCCDLDVELHGSTARGVSLENLLEGLGSLLVLDHGGQPDGQERLHHGKQGRRGVRGHGQPVLANDGQAWLPGVGPVRREHIRVVEYVGAGHEGHLPVDARVAAALRNCPHLLLALDGYLRVELRHKEAPRVDVL